MKKWWQCDSCNWVGEGTIDSAGDFEEAHQKTKLKATGCRKCGGTVGKDITEEVHKEMGIA